MMVCMDSRGLTVELYSTPTPTFSSFEYSWFLFAVEVFLCRMFDLVTPDFWFCLPERVVLDGEI
jgi:hypothetical protein